MSFRDRCEAGRLLADRLISYRRGESIVMAVPRGGVAVAAEIAAALNAEMDFVLVQKIGAPYNKDYAIGALSEAGGEVIDDEAVSDLDVEPAYLERMRRVLSADLAVRRSRLRGDIPVIPVRDRTVIMVDDGAATGLTLKAAALTVRQSAPSRMVLAVPVAAVDSLALLSPLFDDIICLEPAEIFFSVGQFYDRFETVSDETVYRLLREGCCSKTLGR